jgi:hypothetical protein
MDINILALTSRRLVFIRLWAPVCTKDPATSNKDQNPYSHEMAAPRADNERTDRSKFPELRQKDGINNYGAWAVKAKYRLIMMKLWDYIEGPMEKPPIVPILRRARRIRGPDENGNVIVIHDRGNQAEVDAAQALAAPWLERDSQALDLILNAVPDDLLYLVKRSNSAKQAWNSLRTSMQPANSTRALAIKQRIVSYNCESGFNVMRWLDDCQCQYDELCNMDPGSMPDIEFAKTLISNMPVDSNWRNFMSGLRQEYSKKTEHPGSIEVINTIRDEYWAQHKDDPDTYSTVFSAKFQAEGSRKRSLDNSGSSERPNPKRQQQGSGQTQWRDKSKLWCTVKDCESPARHESTDCFAYGGGKQGQYPQWYRGPRDIHLPKSQREARKTRPRILQTRVEDPVSTPRQDAPSVAQGADRADDDSRSHFVVPNTSSSDQAKINQLTAGASRVWMTHIPPGVLDNDKEEIIACAIPIADDSMEKTDDCYHDSGANRHVFHAREAFAEYTQIDPVRVHAFSEGLTIAATGRGSVNLRGTYKGKPAMYTLTNCLHVPGAHANLISQIRLDKFGVSTLFDNGKVVLFKDGAPCIDGAIHNEMWRLNLHPIKAMTEGNSVVMLAKAKEGGADFCTA